ncbi:unnamed protein product, partial [Laminaria digitata]
RATVERDRQRHKEQVYRDTDKGGHRSGSVFTASSPTSRRRRQNRRHHSPRRTLPSPKPPEPVEAPRASETPIRLGDPRGRNSVVSVPSAGESRGRNSGVGVRSAVVRPEVFREGGREPAAAVVGYVEAGSVGR